jgi:probable F420-dependent oxidoreductase
VALEIGPHGVWSNFDRLPAADLIGFARRAEELGYDAFWAQETAGREPFALLSHIAAHTTRIMLGVGIAILYARDALTARAAAATVHELSGGRMVLGLGASHHDTVSQLRGHEYRGPLSAMREYLEAYEAADYRGPLPAGDPPLVLAALRRRMLELAATQADGAFPYLVPVTYVVRARSLLDEAATGAGRPRPALIVTCATRVDPDPASARRAARAYLDRYLGLPNYLANLGELGYGAEELSRPGADRLVDDLVAWGDEGAVRDRLRGYLQAGADHVAIVPLTAEGKMADRETMELLAPPW